MNKEEFKTYLVGKTIYVTDIDDCEKIQKKLFSLGFGWMCTNQTVTIFSKNFKPGFAIHMSDSFKLTWEDCTPIYPLPKNYIYGKDFLNMKIDEDLNLCEILKDCPKGTEFYSSILGRIQFIGINESDNVYPVMVKNLHGDKYFFTRKGFYYPCFSDAECVIFPSKDQRDWSKWVCPKPDLPIDTSVMVSDSTNNWYLRYYAGNKETWVDGFKSDTFTAKRMDDKKSWKHIVPFSKFNPENIKESLKYDIC